jgi:two-component system cell cycle sensor histidine kinase/response regulator CckA
MSIQRPSDPRAPSTPPPEWQPSPEATLEHLYRLQTVAHLVGILSHELRGLLSPTSSYCQLALGALPPTHPLVPNLHEMLETNTQAIQLLNALQKFARSQLGPLVTLRPSVFLADILPRLRALLGPTVFVHLEHLAPDDLITTDPHQLEHALRLLVMRALTAMPHGGELRLRTDSAVIDANHTPTHVTPRHGTYTTISVTDTGFPLPPSKVRDFFDAPLSDPAQDPIEALHMATVATILRRLDGGISATSSPGQGTCITLFLPHPAR